MLLEQVTRHTWLFKIMGLLFFRSGLTALHLAKLFTSVLNEYRGMPLQSGSTLHHLSHTAT